jgi:hypothetical protein
VVERFPRTLVVVVADFDESTAEALALRKWGARVMAVGTASPRAKARLERHGVLTTGLVESPADMLCEATDRIGGADAVLVARGEFDGVFQAIEQAEMEFAALSGRPTIPLLYRRDPRYRFLRSARQWAAFTLARACRAPWREAKEFARDPSGYTAQDTDTRASA